MPHRYLVQSIDRLIRLVTSAIFWHQHVFLLSSSVVTHSHCHHRGQQQQGSSTPLTFKINMVAWSPLICFVPFLSGFRSEQQQVVGSQSRRECRLHLAANAELLPVIREGVAEMGGEESWKESVATLSSRIEIDLEEAELLLADAKKWKGWATAGKIAKRYIKPEIPDVNELNELLDWLTESGPLQLDQEQLRTSIQELPKVYLADPQNTYKKTLKAAPKDYKDPSVLKEMILKDPSVLQYTYNCDEEDGCASECGNCWVSYALRKK